MAKVSLLVYGSLINRNELLNSKIELLSCRPVVLQGFKREFSQEPSYRLNSSINRAVLTVKKEQEYYINSLLLDIYAKDLKLLDEREKGYDRLKVDSYYIEPKYDLIKELKQKDIFIYSGKKIKYSSEILPNKSYLELCLQGAKAWGELFYKDFLKTTFVQKKPLEELL